MNKFWNEAMGEEMRDQLGQEDISTLLAVAASHIGHWALEFGIPLETADVSMGWDGRFYIIGGVNAFKETKMNYQLYLADNCVTYLYKLPASQAVRDMEYVLRLDAFSFSMEEAVRVFDAFYSEAEECVIGGMKPEWMQRFDEIGREHTRRQRLTNPYYCKWEHVPTWFAEHESYNGMRDGKRSFMDEIECQNLGLEL